MVHPAAELRASPRGTGDLFASEDDFSGEERYRKLLLKAAEEVLDGPKDS